MNENIEINIPILKNAHFFSSSWSNKEIDVLNEIVQNSGKIPILTTNLEIVKPKFYLMLSDEIDKSELFQQHNISATGREFHLLTLKFNYDSRWIHNLLSEQSDKHDGKYINFANRKNIISFIEEIIDNIIYSLFIMLSLVDPGSITFDNSLVRLKDYEYLSESNYNSISCRYAVDYAEKIQWPTIKRLNIEQVSEWLSSRTNFILGLGDNQIDKALIAYANTFYDINNQSLVLLWSMQALETLYCNNANNLLESLHTNSEIFLGKRSKFKNTIKSMYKIRSKFIHGNMNITSLFYPNGFIYQNSNKFELSDSIHSILSVLISTLQKILIEQRSKLIFKKTYVLLD